MTTASIILASGSSFRKALLDSAGVDCLAVAPTVDEDSIVGDTPTQTAQMRARAKAQDVAGGFLDAYVIGADQTLELKGQCFGKVLTPEEARVRLGQLSGQVHYLRSAFCIINQAKQVQIERVESIELCMRGLTDQEISRYVDTDEWKGSCGCYRIEGKGIQLFSTPILADSSSVIGLPLISLLEEFRGLGVSFL